MFAERQTGNGSTRERVGSILKDDQIGEKRKRLRKSILILKGVLSIIREKRKRLRKSLSILKGVLSIIREKGKREKAY